MFGVCVWAELNPSSIFYIINRQLSVKFNSQIHNPHITLDYDIDLNKCNKSNYKLFKLYKTGNIYQTQNKNFYSLQQDYIYSNNIHHVSLAYKANIPFNKNDIDFANSLDTPSIIHTNELSINVWNCNSLYTNEWYKVI